MALSYRWIKLYIEILDDFKMGVLPNHLWRRVVELFLVAGERGRDGSLGSVPEIAWRLRVNEVDLLQSLRSLEEIGIVRCAEDDTWIVTKFAERQAAEPVGERVEAYRKRQGNADSNEPVTKRYTEERREDKKRIEERRIDNDVGGVFRLYESEVGSITKAIADEITLAVGEYPIEWFEAAFQEAALHNARNWKYVHAILKSWKANGYQSRSGKNGDGKTVEELYPTYHAGDER